MARVVGEVNLDAVRVVMADATEELPAIGPCAVVADVDAVGVPVLAPD